MAPPPATMESFWKWVKNKSAHLSRLDRRRHADKPSRARPPTLMALRTIMMASCSDRSVSSVNCSAPPLRMMVHVCAFGQPLKKLYLQTDRVAVSQSEPGLLFGMFSFRTHLSCLSPPTWTSSKSSHCPRTSSVIAPTEVWMEPPQAWR